MFSGDINDKWEEVCSHVSTYPDVNISQFNAILAKVKLQAMSEGFVLLSTENEFLKNWAEKNFSSIVQRSLEDIYKMPFTVAIEIDESSSSSSANQQGNEPQNAAPEVLNSAIIEEEMLGAPHKPQSFDEELVGSPVSDSIVNESISISDLEIATSESIQLGEQGKINIVDSSKTIKNPSNVLSSLTFENFVIGESNRMAYSMAVQVAEVPGRTALNPLFIYGKSGLGKTHLMRAIQNYINETQPHLVTIYADSEELISGYTDAVAEHDKEKSSYKNFKTYYENADVLLIDDIQFLQGKIQTLDIVFQIFNKLINQGKQIVLSADRSPKNIDMEERYSSRFVQGGLIDIQPPEIETKLAIVKSYIKEYSEMEHSPELSIPDDAQMYIAENSGSNIRELKGAVNIIFYHLNFSEKNTISLSEVEHLLENHFTSGFSRNLTVEDIQKEVENYYKVKHSDMVGSTRAREIVFPRQVAMYLSRQLLDTPFKNIGKKFNRDHTTVMHSVAKVESELLTNRNVQEEIEVLKKVIKEL